MVESFQKKCEKEYKLGKRPDELIREWGFQPGTAEYNHVYGAWTRYIGSENRLRIVIEKVDPKLVEMLHEIATIMGVRKDEAASIILAQGLKEIVEANK